MYHLNQFKDDLEAIATNHRQINTFGFGDLWEVDLSTSTSGIIYPLVWVEPGDARFEGEHGNIFKMDFRFFFLDLVAKDESNEVEVYNDQLLVAVDFMTTLNTLAYKENFNALVKAGVFERVTESFGESDDGVAGWKVTIAVQFFNLWDRCAIPTVT